MLMMTAMKEESGVGWGPRVCDTCRSAACAVYCRAESAYLCAGCDARTHHHRPGGGGAWRHERVRVCEACERAPAALACKADAASLCGPCDALVHSANPLARRHNRLPILPLPAPSDGGGGEEDEAASWLLPAKANNAGGFFADEYLDLVGFDEDEDDDDDVQTAATGNNASVSDSVVPCGGGDYHHHHHHHGYYGKGINDDVSNNGETMDMNVMMNSEEAAGGFQLGFDVFEQAASSPKPTAAYGYTSASIRHTVSVSSMDVSVVPDSAMSEMSISHPRQPKGTIDLFSGPPAQIPAQLTPLDREARVLRYREKKKNRKFEKTIRYASRKAYAETRPRIKGRFAKRTDVEVDVDQMFSTALMADSGYGIVPSF